MKLLDEVVAIVARIADNEGFTPGGLLDYLRDIDRYPEVYGKDAEKIEQRLFGGTGIGPEDVTKMVCSLASTYHLQHVRESIKRWQKEADEAKVPITFVLVGDAELGYEAVMRDRWGRGVVNQNAGDPIPNARRSSARIQGPVVLGQSVEALVRWMGAVGWDIHDAKEALAMYGGDDVQDADLLAWLKSGRDGLQTGNIPESVQEKLREALE